MSVVAVLDFGATNTRVSAATFDGTILETVTAPSAWVQGPPYLHRDLAATEVFLRDSLRTLAARHRIEAIVPCSHGSGGVLVDEHGPVLPMIVYEQPVPADVDKLFATLAGSYRERGSPIMLGATHTGRQMLWMETGWPDEFARARWFLGLAQYWSWRLSGVPTAELSILGAQSNLWNVQDGCFTSLVHARGWQHLMPPIVPAWQCIGPLLPEWASQTGLPQNVRVLCGVHDSTANFYRYQTAGLRGFTVVSTGTWIVGLSDATDIASLSERHGMTCNADVAGHPLAGVLSMGGREFSAVAGSAMSSEPVHAETIIELVSAGTMAVPCFSNDDALFPGRAGRGQIVGPPPKDAGTRRALAELYTALLTDTCLDALNASGTVVLDGTFVRQAIFPSLVAALRPDDQISYNLDAYGTASGTALLADHATRTLAAPVSLRTPTPLAIPALAAYRARWREMANTPPDAPMPKTPITETDR